METKSSISQRVCLLGYGPMCQAVLEGLLAVSDSSVDVVGLFLWPGPGDRGDTLETMALKHTAKQHGIALLRFKKANDWGFLRYLQAERIDTVFIASWGEIFKPWFLDACGIPFVNCHPSLLPAYRGPNPYICALLDGVRETGVTFHLIDSGIDTGPILAQVPVPVSAQETGGSLRTRCANAAKSLLPDVISALRAGLSVPQPPVEGQFYHRPNLNWVWIDWQQPPEIIVRRIAAFWPWYPAMTVLKGQWVSLGLATLEATTKEFSASSGCIVKSETRAIWVTSIDPTTLIRFTQPRLYHWPAIVSRLLAPWLFKPGHCFAL